jgi:hypothetical protein
VRRGNELHFSTSPSRAARASIPDFDAFGFHAQLSQLPRPRLAGPELFQDIHSEIFIEIHHPPIVVSILNCHIQNHHSARNEPNRTQVWRIKEERRIRRISIGIWFESAVDIGTAYTLNPMLSARVRSLNSFNPSVKKWKFECFSNCNSDTSDSAKFPPAIHLHREHSDNPPRNKEDAVSFTGGLITLPNHGDVDKSQPTFP